MSGDVLGFNSTSNSNSVADAGTFANDEKNICKSTCKEKTEEKNSTDFSKETIFALSSGAGVAGIAVIRLSGPDTLPALRRITNRQEFKPRYAHYCTLKNPQTEEVLDQALVLFFPAPHSFTGEDVAELHIHGGRAVLQSVLKTLSRIKGLRPALAGEYSKRAVMNGKMDLTQAEGLIDLIHAQTEKQQQQAFRQMQGALQKLYDSWREMLVHDLALMEAYIDFPEEEIPDSVLSQVQTNALSLVRQIRDHLADEGRGERLREGFRIALVGKPNVGKSSLLNRLTGREAAIVSSTAGTTRDVIETYLDIKGYPVILADTAGLHDTQEEIEKEGILRAQKQIKEADLVLLLQDARTYPETDITLKPSTTEKTLVVWNKKDLANALPAEGLFISAKTGEGCDILWKKIESVLEDKMGLTETPAVTRLRYRLQLEECLQNLQNFLNGSVLELQAEDLRLAARALGKITGRVEVEELFDIIFKDFCIGK